MPLDESDRVRLSDMRKRAAQIIDFTSGINFETFSSTLILQLAVERNLEVIGEAASHVSSELRSAHPEIRWSSIIGQRNFLIHVYVEIKLEVIWETVIEDIPLLVKQLDEVFSSYPRA